MDKSVNVVEGCLTEETDCYRVEDDWVLVGGALLQVSASRFLYRPRQDHEPMFASPSL